VHRRPPAWRPPRTPAREFRRGHRQELPERGQRARVGRPVIEHAEDAWYRQPTAGGFVEEVRHAIAAVMRDDLRQVELRGRMGVEEVVDLRRRIAVRIRPAPERQRRHPPPDPLAQLPRVLDTAGRSDAPVAAEHDERIEPLLVRAVRVTEAIVERVLARQKRHDARPRHVGAEVDDEVAEVVLFLRPDRAVGEKHVGAAAREPAHRMVRVDPRVHARRAFELGPGRAQLCRDDGLAGVERLAKSHGERISILTVHVRTARVAAVGSPGDPPRPSRSWIAFARRSA
jgi:hypothetical protein